MATASPGVASPGPGALTFRWLFFPFTLGLSLWLAHELWQAGQAPGSVIGLSSLAAIALIALCERLAPHRREWNLNHGDVVADVAHNLVTSFGLRELLKFGFAVTLVQHANVRHEMGWGHYVFSSAVLHRWHHSDVLVEANSNYGSSLIVWDLVFGTYFNPPGRELGPERIGLAAMREFPQRFWASWAVPLRWKALERANGLA